MRIDNLPNEILLKILKYVPRFDQVELVNKKFYDAAVKLTNTNLCIIVEPELFVRILDAFFKLPVTDLIDSNFTIGCGKFGGVQLDHISGIAYCFQSSYSLDESKTVERNSTDYHKVFGIHQTCIITFFDTTS